MDKNMRENELKLGDVFVFCNASRFEPQQVIGIFLNDDERLEPSINDLAYMPYPADTNKFDLMNWLESSWGSASEVKLLEIKVIKR
jgi:hypothetical protein